MRLHITEGYDPKHKPLTPPDMISSDEHNVWVLRYELAKLKPGGTGILIQLEVGDEEQMPYLKKWLKAHGAEITGGLFGMRKISCRRLACWVSAV